MIDTLIPISLGESISHCVAQVLLDQKQDASRRHLCDYEIEIRVGGVSLKPGERTAEFLNRCTDEYTLLPARDPIDETSKFKSGVLLGLFERATEEILGRLEPLCAVITPFSVRHVKRHDAWRYETDPVGGTTLRTCKVPLGKHCDFLRRSDGEPANTRDAWWRAALRVAVSYEHTEPWPAGVMCSAERVKRRRSVYLYDSSALAVDADTWLSADKVVAYLAATPDCLPVNCWRIDFTRINTEEFQIELELNLGEAVARYGDEHERMFASVVCKQPDPEGKQRVSFIRYRILAALGECLYRLEHAINPALTPPTWCRKY